jgi:hypothetical protein
VKRLHNQAGVSSIIKMLNAEGLREYSGLDTEYDATYMSVKEDF